MINDTNITKANNILEIAVATNDASGGVLFPFILIGIFSTVLIVFMQKDFKEAFLGASSLSALLGIIFWGAGLVEFSFLIIFIVLTFVSIFVYVFTKD
jgi:hypothetical protein